MKDKQTMNQRREEITKKQFLEFKTFLESENYFDRIELKNSTDNLTDELIGFKTINDKVFSSKVRYEFEDSYNGKRLGTFCFRVNYRRITSFKEVSNDMSYQIRETSREFFKEEEKKKRKELEKAWTKKKEGLKNISPYSSRYNGVQLHSSNYDKVDRVYIDIAVDFELTQENIDKVNDLKEKLKDELLKLN